MVFDRDWFRDHQRPLLALLNWRITRRWFRRCLRIWEDRDICDIGPSHFTVATGSPNEFTSDFRCAPKYARRLYATFKPLWYVLHYWDALTAPVPVLSFGFDTLTVYPDASIGGTTVDGTTKRLTADNTFSVIRAAAADSVDMTATYDQIAYLKSSYTTNQFKYLNRGIFTFDTSALTASALISAATISLFGQTSTNGLGDSTIVIVSAAPASNNTLVEADHGTLGTTAYHSGYSGAWTSAYSVFTMNATGRAAISKTGISKFGTRLEWDRANSFSGTWRSNNSTGWWAYMADDTSGTKDPKLVITFTKPFLGGTVIL